MDQDGRITREDIVRVNGVDREVVHVVTTGKGHNGPDAHGGVTIGVELFAGMELPASVHARWVWSQNG
jgi:hypothetical protein